jgi:hypothetical protein
MFVEAAVEDTERFPEKCIEAATDDGKWTG